MASDAHLQKCVPFIRVLQTAQKCARRPVTCAGGAAVRVLRADHVCTFVGFLSNHELHFL